MDVHELWKAILEDILVGQNFPNWCRILSIIGLLFSCSSIRSSIYWNYIAVGLLITGIQ